MRSASCSARRYSPPRREVPRRNVLIGLMVVFTAAIMVAAMASSYANAARRSCPDRAAHGAFFGHRLGGAPAMVGPDRRATADLDAVRGLPWRSGGRAGDTRSASMSVARDVRPLRGRDRRSAGGHRAPGAAPAQRHLRGCRGKIAAFGAPGGLALAVGTLGFGGVSPPTATSSQDDVVAGYRPRRSTCCSRSSAWA